MLIYVYNTDEASTGVANNSKGESKNSNWSPMSKLFAIKRNSNHVIKIKSIAEWL